MSLDPLGTTASGAERRPEMDEPLRPSHDSTQGLLRSGVRPLEPKYSTSAPPEPYTARLEFDRSQDEPLPPRHPSRQMMRWGPPPSEYGWDDREERRPWGRPSYDYGRPMRTTPAQDDYYAEDPSFNRPYRRAPSVREPPPSARGPPRPASRRTRRAPHWDDLSEDDGSEEDEPVRKRIARKRVGSTSSPPPEEILRLPFTMWMNSSLKNRTFVLVQLGRLGA